MKQQFYGWKLLAVLWIIMAFTTGFPYFGGNIMNTYMAAEQHLDRKSLGLAFAVFALCMGLFGPLAGFCVNRWGVRLTIALGTAMAAIGALAMALAVTNMYGVVIAYGLIMGVGAALGGALPAQASIAYWFRRKIAMALAIMLTGSIFGGFIAAPLLDRLIVAFAGDWRAGWFLLAALSCVSFLCTMLFVKNKPADIGQLQDGMPDAATGPASATAAPSGATVYKTTDDWSSGEAVRHPTLWLLVLGAICFLSGYSILVAHGVAHFKDLGHSTAAAAMFLGLLPLAGLVGKALAGALGDRIEPRFIWALAMLAAAIGIALSVRATSGAELYVSAFLAGAGSSAAYVCMVTLVANYYGKSAYADLLGIVFPLVTVVTASAPFAAGMVFDLYGSYALAFYPAAALCLLGAAGLPFVRPPVRALARAAQIS